MRGIDILESLVATISNVAPYKPAQDGERFEVFIGDVPGLLGQRTVILEPEVATPTEAPRLNREWEMAVTIVQTMLSVAAERALDDDTARLDGDDREAPTAEPVDQGTWGRIIADCEEIAAAVQTWGVSTTGILSVKLEPGRVDKGLRGLMCARLITIRFRRT